MLTFGNTMKVTNIGEEEGKVKMEVETTMIFNSMFVSMPAVMIVDPKEMRTNIPDLNSNGIMSAKDIIQSFKEMADFFSGILPPIVAQS